MSEFTIDKARLVGLFLECIAYGIFLVTFPPCIQALIHADGRFRKPASINWLLLLTALIMASFVTFDVILSLVWNIQVFVNLRISGHDVPTEFNDISDWINILKTANLVFPIIISDAVIIYRCWVVYNRKYLLILLSTLIWVADASMGLFAVFLESHLHTRGSLEVRALTPTLTSFLVMTVALNFITTTLIIGRIHLVDRQSAQYIATASTQRTVGSSGIIPLRARTRLQRVMRIMVESGLLYTTTATVSLIAYLAGSLSFNSVTDAVRLLRLPNLPLPAEVARHKELPIMAIAFNLIIIPSKSQGSGSTEYTISRQPTPSIKINVCTASSQYPQHSASGMNAVAIELENSKSGGFAMK
ncbi:hypothetical protein ONZ45_g15164 [Pleurotus djamor]|nr:hypothetical protein ONZ45_g15164 [Pleurotus djamor]